MHVMTEFSGHKNLQITQHGIDQSCTFFSKAQVCQSFWRSRMQRARLFPYLVRSGQNHGYCGLWGFYNMHSQSSEF